MGSSRKPGRKRGTAPSAKGGGRGERERPPWLREGIGISLIGLAMFLFLSLFSYSPRTDPGLFQAFSPSAGEIRNLGGPVGAYAASALRETLGQGAYFLAALLVLAALRVMGGKGIRPAPWKIPLGLLTLVWISTLFSLLLGDRPALSDGGGLVGHQTARWLLEALHPAGSYLLLAVLLILSVAALGEISILEVLRRTGRGAGRLFDLAWRGALAGLESLFQASKALVDRGRARLRGLAGSLGDRWAQWRRRAEAPPGPSGAGARGQEAAPRIVQHGPPRHAAGGEKRPAEASPTPTIVPPGEGKNPLTRETSSPGGGKGPAKPVQAALPFPDPLPEGYRLPPLDLLDDPDTRQAVIDEEGLKESAGILEQKLRDFGVQGRVSEIHPGPIITLFEFEPAKGIKVNRIVNLADDLALAMKAMSVRIVAPIPGKAVVGIEVPNRHRQTVYLKEILADKAFQACSWKIPLALGKDIAGKPVTTDLSRMPHLLIAGATGTGKSVNLHSLILSILFRFTPEEAKFLMIDPKMLELTAYHGIPHLLHPVITDARRASDVLDWAVERMEQRYQLLSEKGVRNIESYNERIDRERAERGEEGLEEEEEEGLEGTEDGELMPEKGKLPYIILVIDEMADLMLVSGRQIEESITRLAQMARAAGIHLLLATQRPSVDVLTGIIKANLPARISFQVSSRTDSRTILDCIGAEKLLGQGDMLFLPPGTSKVRRIHGPFVSEPEIERVANYIKQFGRPRYEKIVFRNKQGKETEEEFEFDEKYDEAVRLVAETRQASISMIQRKLRVGYNRAARMIERMEKEGVVGPQEGVKPREVLISSLE